MNQKRFIIPLVSSPIFNLFSIFIMQIEVYTFLQKKVATLQIHVVYATYFSHLKIHPKTFLYQYMESIFKIIY